MSLRLVTPPASTAVSLEEAKGQLGVLHNEFDTKIKGWIAVASGHFDGPKGILTRALITQTWALDLPAFPTRRRSLPLAPVSEIVSVKCWGPDGQQHDVADSAWRFEPGDYPFFGPAAGASWPATATGRPDAVTIEFKAGEARAPEPVRAAFLMLIEALSEGTPPSDLIDRLVLPLRYYP